MRKLLLMIGMFLALAGPAFAAPEPGVLVDQLGHPVKGAALSGHYLLIYFGYTNCPDVCPTTLNLMSDVLGKLGPKRNNLKAFFVTVDPTRDTPDVMRQYLKHFSPYITGLTGTPDDIAAAAARFHVPVKPGPDGTISHGLFIYFFGPDGRLLKSFHPDAGAGDILKDIEAVLEKPAS